VDTNLWHHHTLPNSSVLHNIVQKYALSFTQGRLTFIFIICMKYTRGNKNWPLCMCQWPARRYSCYHNIAIYFHHDIIDCSPSHTFRTNYTRLCHYLFVCKKKNCIMLETEREANKIINNFRGECEVYNVDLFIFL
jgi:hypothetical protein